MSGFIENKNILDSIIAKRRSVYPPSYIKKEISDQTILDILENANYAPNHRKTEPWRFVIIKDEGLKQLSTYLGDYYKKNTPQEKYSEIKFEKTINKPLLSSCVIAICMQRDPEERLPEWEEVSAVSMAVQNMWLSCHVRGIGCYFSTPSSAASANDFLELKTGERCLGWFYMGYKDDVEIPARRGPVSDKIKWMRD